MQKLKSKLSLLLVPFFVLVLIAIFGCAAMQELVVPMHVDEEAKDYAEDDATSYLPWPTLWDGKRLAVKMKRKNEMNQRDLGRLMVDDASFYAFIANQQLLNIRNAEELKETMFSPSGPMGLLLPALAGMGLGAFAISKPADKKKIVGLEKSSVRVAETVSTV